MYTMWVLWMVYHTAYTGLRVRWYIGIVCRLCGMLCRDVWNVMWICGEVEMREMVCRRHSISLTAGWAEALPVERDVYQDATPCGLHITSR